MAKAENIGGNTKKLTLVHIVYIFLACLLTINVGLQSWSLKQVGSLGRALSALDKRLVAVEANRFTMADGVLVNEKIHALSKTLACIPKDIPPLWLLDRVGNIRKDFTTYVVAQAVADKEVARNLNSISQAVVRIETKLDVVVLPP